MQIVEYTSSDGSTVRVRVQPTAPDDLVTRGLGSSELVGKAERTFEAALQPIRTVAEGVVSELSSMARHPDEVSVEFGLEFTAKFAPNCVERDRSMSTWMSAAPVVGV